MIIQNPQPLCPTCGENALEQEDSFLKECCMQAWIQQKILNHYK